MCKTRNSSISRLDLHQDVKGEWQVERKSCGCEPEPTRQDTSRMAVALLWVGLCLSYCISFPCAGWANTYRLYTNAEDTLDPDDLIFPRAATRTGAKFQANVMTWEEQQAAEERHRLGESEAGPSRHIARESSYL